MPTNFPTSLDALSNPTSTSALNNPSHAGQHSDTNDAIEAIEAKVGVDGSVVTSSHSYKIAQLETNSATLTGTQTLTNKTLTNPTINGALLNYPEEVWNVTASAIAATNNIDVLTSPIWYFQGAAGVSTFALNFRGNSGTTLSSLLAVNTSMSVTVAVTQTGTASYANSFTIDSGTGSAVTVTPKWQGALAPTSGNANSIDLYTFTILKTAATPTYTVFASRTRFSG